jgi:alpha-tubulin suppressor-like RCC1 family protein
MSIKGIDITQLGYRWKGIYSSAATYINNDVVYNNGGVYVYRNGSLQAFALGQQDAALAGALAANGVVSVGTWGTVLHSNGPGSSLVFKFQNDRNGIIATKLQHQDTMIGEYAGMANYMMAIMNEGQVRSWGYTNGGSSGTGTMSGNGQTLPKQVPFPKGTPPIIDIYSNYDQSFFIDASGGLWSCGPNSESSSGFGAASGVPVKLNGVGQLPANAVVTKVVAGYDWYGGRHQGCIDSNGRVYWWGNNNNGCWGMGNTNTSTTPMLVPFTVTNPMKLVIPSGGNYGCCWWIDLNGILWASGATDWCGLSGGNVVVPEKLMPWGDSDTIKMVRKTETNDHYNGGTNYWGRICAISDAGNLYMWGDDAGNVAGGWGTGYTGSVWSGNSKFPGYLCLTGVQDAFSCSGGYSRSFALMKDGTVKATGYDGYNVNGGVGNVTNWHTIGGSYLTNVIKMKHVGATYGSSLYALRSDGKMVCWGKGDVGNMGIGTANAANSPAAFVALEKFIVDFSVVGYTYGDGIQTTVFALTSDGRIYGWGSAYAGLLGDSRDNNRYSPHPIIF